ncbi:hypothetical protein FOCC_FOCC012244 [Frankliniella occidentalis]|nr:hypothetical protein FOCC_FOCC012244 [Frankliniella occidentalis]
MDGHLWFCWIGQCKRVHAKETQLSNLLSDSTQPSTPQPQDESDSAANTGETPLVGPLQIRGLPKAKEAGGKKRKPRREEKCMTATDAPVKEEIGKGEEDTQQKKKT